MRRIALVVSAVTVLRSFGIVYAGPAPNRGASAGSRGSPPRFWRQPENDGINSLYLQLRLLGYSDSYGAFWKKATGEGVPQDFASLARIGRQFGFRMAVVQSTLPQLRKAQLPAIVHIEEEGVDSGRFCLLLPGSADANVRLIGGGVVKFTLMSEDSFLRIWGGFALVPQAENAVWSITRRIGAAVLACWAVWIAAIRVRRLSDGSS